MAYQPELVAFFARHLGAGESFATITQARKHAAEVLGELVHPGTALAKQVDESVEAGVVRTAQAILQTSTTTHDTYDRLVDLHDRQPALNVRSSTSVLQQAYSTPIPIAFLASTLAGITPNTTVYEPTAGHGALLLGTDPAKVTVNELSADRAADLRVQGYVVTQFDATEYQPDQQHDVVIANPPFGAVRDDQGQRQRFALPGNRRGTTQIDQAIAFQALKAMKADGRAVLILGGKLGEAEGLRSDRYNTLESRGFFYPLYQQYHVIQHFSLSGDLYRKQGAGFPIDVMVIAGRGRSELPLPAAVVPPIYTSFAELKELIPNERLRRPSPHLRGLRDLHPDLETADNGRSGLIPGAGAARSDAPERSALRAPDESAGAVDDSHLDGRNRGDPARDRSPPRPSPANSLFSANAAAANSPWHSGTTSPAGMGRRLERDPRASQRNPENPLRPAERLELPDQHSTPERDPAGMAGGTQRGDDLGNLAELSDRRDDLRQRPVATPEPAPKIETQVHNIPYIPRSQGTSPKTLIPANMAAAAQVALQRVEQAHGNIDKFVSQRLGYDSKAAMWQVLYAEQIDSLALAFDQRDRGKIFLNGDQTGNGKGRFGAANLIDARRQGYIPIFVTRQPDLYNAMINDLADIGKPGFTPFLTNNNLTLRLDDGRVLKTGSGTEQETEMRRLVQQGELGQDYGAIFTTYSQLQTIKNQEPLRRQFFRALASRAIFVFDESHEAGGSTGQSQSWKTSGPPNRSEFVRELIDHCAGAVFMSATATKDPAVMDLYARRSDAMQAVSSLGSLERSLQAGGIPLQQMMATQFVASGQLLRRERSFENISFVAQVVSVDREVADGISAIMRSVDAFDRAKVAALTDLRKELKQQAKQLGLDNAVGQVGVHSTNFTSLMHNAIDQGLLCQKAEATVQSAIQALENGEKPLIAVASTMDAFIDWYAKDNGLEPGDELDISFGDVLGRYLERSRDVVLKDFEGLQHRRRLTDEELGADGVAAYDAARELIADTDLSQVPLSSIDYIKWRLHQEGYTVDEVTGRKNIVEYGDDRPMNYGRRSSQETKPQGKIEVVNRFNYGQLDVVILNRSGSTGISLHASEKFADQRPRHMIVAQAERDINQVMQMLGRANRFGQVIEPRFTLLMSDLPAEKRLGALLAKKMASLNANTTASRDSDLSVTNVVDFMNIYGEAVVQEILEDDPELQARLAFPAENLQGSSDIELISRVTGRIPLLPIEEQEALYSLIESETQDLIAQKQAMGENVLSAEQLDLDARTIARMEVIPDDSGIRNEFTGPVYLEVVDAKIPVKPLTQLQVMNTVREVLGLDTLKAVADHDFDQVQALAEQRAAATLQDLQQQLQDYRHCTMLTKKTPEARGKLSDRLASQLDQITDILTGFPPGTPVQLVSEQSHIVYGVVANVWQRGRQGSPAAPTNWRLQVLTDNHSRQITFPLSKVNTNKDNSVSLLPQATNWDGLDIYAAFDHKQAQQRREAQIFTGNLLRAFEKYPRGQFLNYTDHQGRIRQGLIMPAGFDIEESLRAEPVAFREPYQVKAFLTEVTGNKGVVKTLDEFLVIKTQAAARLSGSQANGFVLQTPKATSVGGQYFLDQDILATVGSDFYSVSDRMEAVVSADLIDPVLAVVMQEKKLTLAAFDFKDQARAYLGEALPTLELVESNTFAAQGDYVPYVPEPTPQTREQLESLFVEEFEELAQFEEQVELDQDIRPAQEREVETTAKALAPPQPHLENPIPQPDLPQNAPRIAPLKEQTGDAEKQVAKFLHTAGLAEVVLQGEDFHQRIENEPYIPLVVERHSDQLYLTHYLTQNGDMFIDTEMVFGITGSYLTLRETAVQSFGGEFRSCDRGFAQLFARNINHQGFAEAARAQVEQSQEEELAATDGQPSGKQVEVDRQAFPADVQQYLAVKEQHPDVLVLVQTSDRRFYEAFFDDAKQLAQTLDLILTSQTPTALNTERIPAAGFPVQSLAKYLEPLRQVSAVAIADIDGAIAVHTQQADQPIIEDAPTPNPQPGTGQTTAKRETEEPEFHVQSLFDPDQFSHPYQNGHRDHLGNDPTWQNSTAASIPTTPASETVRIQSTQPLPQPSLQDVADEVRGIDLEIVAANLGLELDRYDKHKWRNGDHIISISGPLFMDWLADQGGRGAIDLVMHVQEVEFKAAVEWLSGQDLSHRPVHVSTYQRSEEREPHSLEMPAANEHRWNAVRGYLVETRKLPAVLVDRLHERELVYGDAHQNAVFVRYSLNGNAWTRGAVTGASLRGTWGEDNHYHGLAPGSIRDQGWFWLGTGHGPVQRVFLTESPIDAMSLAVLDQGRQARPGVTIYLSTDGSGGVPIEALKPVLQEGGRVFAAFDADQPGTLMAWRVAEQVPGVERLMPKHGKDWNERLIHAKDSASTFQPIANNAEMDQLWQWHLTAKRLGRPGGYLSRITEVARDVVKGANLSDKASVAMTSDMAAFSEVIEKTRATPRDLKTMVEGER
ncbi:MAG: strawberry notch C-terminal domain-containing protein [Leptolyngbyaceae cyanobacterium]